MQINDEIELKKEIGKIVNKEEHYIDKVTALKVVFILKIDSSGEIHSAHIPWSQNLKIDAYYSICYKIESKLNAQFLYDKYKKQFLEGKYVYVRVPYFGSS